MIKFFRKIRQKLLRENHFSRYLIYAIGEIMLVMIGILLAFQVNNWKEKKKTRIHEMTMLMQLNEDLKTNLGEIEGIYQRVVENSKAKDSILYYLENPVIFEIKLKLQLHQIQFAGGNFNNANTTYKYIESKGVNALSNESIRKKITMMYDNYFENIEIRQSLRNQHFFTSLFPIIRDYFVPSQITAGTTLPFKNLEVLNFPKNVDELKLNQKFINVLTKLQELSLLRKYTLEITLDKLKELIIEIDKEIIRLKR